MRVEGQVPREKAVEKRVVSVEYGRLVEVVKVEWWV